MLQPQAVEELTVEPVQDDVEIETSGEQSDVFAVSSTQKHKPEFELELITVSIVTMDKCNHPAAISIRLQVFKKNKVPRANL